MAKSRPDPRRAALDILHAVLHQGRPLDEALSGHRPLAALEARDRAFVRLLVSTTLRRLGQIDALLAAMMKRPLPAKQARLKDLLRLGAAQIVFLGTPPHAAVSTSVALTRAISMDGFAALVNAVLRRLAREGAELAAAQDAARLNLPAWLWDALVAAYGEEETRALAAVQLQDPPLDISVKADPAGWAERLEAELLPSGSLRLPAGRGEVTALPGYAEGAWWVQDAAAALPARLLRVQPGERAIDLCAAPGGKTLALAAAGAEVIAVDSGKARMQRLEENLRRLALPAATVVADVGEWRPPAPAAAVLLDAPCTATGTLRRHPDVARLKRPEDAAALSAAQDRLLAAAAEMVEPGGRLVYAVCSLLPEEGPARIAQFLAGGAPFAREPATAAELGVPEACITAEGDLRTLPSHWAERGGLDGFYACRLRRL